MTYLLFILGLASVIKGADFLVSGASLLARRLRVSELIIGLTVVAFGTSAPELLVNVYAGFQGNTDISLGNVLGSNIFNILLILGVAAVIYPLEIRRETVRREIPLCLLSVVILAFVANDWLSNSANPPVISWGDGLVLLTFFSFFLYYMLNTAIRQRREQETVSEATRGIGYSLLLLVGGLLILNLGAKWVVDGAVKISEVFGLSQPFIGLTIVAIGTSLPELATSVAAALKKNADIAVGNIVGSNIFNTFFILGTGAMISPLPFYDGGNFDILVLLVATLALFIFYFTGIRRNILERWEGFIFLSLYFGYMVYLFLRS